jgi:hypothetical protein
MRGVSDKPRKPREVKYCKGKFGNLYRHQWGVTVDCKGVAYLFINGKLVEEKPFKGIISRRVVFIVWDVLYPDSVYDDKYFEVKYEYLNQANQKELRILKRENGNVIEENITLCNAGIEEVGQESITLPID